MTNELIKDIVDSEFHEGYPVSKHINAEVIMKVDGCVDGQHWPGTHTNVNVWFITKSGYFIGYNENPGRGISYPVYKPTREKFEAALTYKEFGWDL